MASEVDPVVLELRAENGKYLSALRQSTTAVDAALGRQQKQVQNLEAQFRKSSGAISSTLKGMAAGFAGAFSVQQIGGMIDSFTRLQNNLRVAGLEGQQLASVQQNLLDLSGKYGTSVEGLSNVFLKASLAQQSLGASTEDILRLNEITAASLKVTGTSATEAQGALLQLGQALGSGVVRAEEFNSILEGAFPLAQAAARGIEGFAGDVAKLRIAIANGEITSKQFFEGVLKGGVQTMADAEKATLTLSGAFESLRSRLTVLIGEEAKANGVTNALSGAIQALSENLNPVINALAVIATLIGVRYVSAIAASTAAMVASTVADARKTAGLAAQNAALVQNAGLLNAQAVAAGRSATAMGVATVAARSMGASLLAAVGGPVGLAIIALAGGLATIAMRSGEAAQATGEYAEQSRRLLEVQQKVEAATEGVATATGKARAEALANAKALREETRQYLANAQAALLAAEAKAREVRERTRYELQNLPVNSGAGGGPDRLQGVLARNTRDVIDANANVKAAQGAVIGFQKEIHRLTGIINAPSSVPAGPIAAGDSKGASSAKKRRRKSSGPSEEEIERRFNDEMISIAQQTLSARRAIAISADERADLEERSVELARRQALNSIEAEKDYTAAQKERLAEAVNNLAALELEGVERQRQSELTRQTTDAMRDEAAALGAESELTRNRIARVAIERRILEIQQGIERDLLDEAIARGEVKDAAEARAMLARRQGAEREGFERGNAGPLAQYGEEIKRVGENLNDEFESIAVSGLKSLNDGLTDAIMNSKNLGDVFKNVSKQIIADLIRIAIQQTIVNSLMGMLGGIFGGPTNLLKGTPYSAPGRASGGHVNAGQIYRVNEAGREFFQPANSGNIIPLGEMNAKLAQSGAAGGVVRVIVEEGPGFASTVRAEATGVAVEVVRASAPAIIQAGATEAQRNMTRPTMGRTY